MDGQRWSPARLPRLPLVLLSLTVVGAVVFGLFTFSIGASASKQIMYEGRMYMGVVEVTQIEARANFGSLRRRPGRIDGKPVFTSAGRPPSFVALGLVDGHLNAYRLMR